MRGSRLPAQPPQVCLNDALHGRVATIPFLVLVERFHESDVLHDFLEIFCEQALATLVPDSAKAGTKGAEASAIRSTSRRGFSLATPGGPRLLPSPSFSPSARSLSVPRGP